jgi:hypothetical protein
MREYVTRQTREAVQQFANFLAVHCGEVCIAAPVNVVSITPHRVLTQSPIFAIVQSLLVSNELLQIVFNVDALQSTLDGRAFLQRRLVTSPVPVTHTHCVSRPIGAFNQTCWRIISAHQPPLLSPP